MKTIVVITIIFLLNLELQAQDQIKKGVYSLGGDISFYSTSNKQNGVAIDESVFSFMPSGSYFIIDQLETSLNLLYTTYSSSGNSGTSLGLGLGVRYYFPYGKLAPFIGANGQSSWFSNAGSSYSSPQSYYSLIGGLEIFISKLAALEPAITYSHYRLNDYFTQSEFRIGIGVKYFIL